MARYVVKQKRPDNRICMEASHSVSLSCNFKLFSNSMFPILLVFKLPLWHAMFEAVETISDFPCFKWAYENTFTAPVSLRWSSILLGWQRTWRHWAVQIERSCDGDGLGPARDVERVESNTGGES